jgi:hypothetical protein
MAKRPQPLQRKDLPVAFGTVSFSDSHDFQSRGFPRAEGTDSYMIPNGILTYEYRKKRFNLNVRSEPRNWEDWAGFSGAVIFSAKLAVGVVRTVNANWERTLTATPVQHLLDDEKFKDYWLSHEQELSLRMLPVQPGVSTLLALIAPRVYLIDRENAVEKVLQHIGKLRLSSESQIIAIGELEDDVHEHVIRQLAQRAEIKNFLKRDAKPENVIVELPWPNEPRPIDPEEQFQKLVSELLRAANISPQRGPRLGPAQLRADIDERGIPLAKADRSAG